MTFVKKPFVLALIAVAAAALSVHAQKPELNPTVKVLAKPQSPVPAECATDQLEAASPALEPEAVPTAEQVMESVPPSNELRASLRRLQVAAEGEDYPAFKAALAEARRAVAAHPPGGEHTAAAAALQVFTDIGRVWDYAMASPTGSFFDSSIQGGTLLNALKRYPDFGRTLADETFISNGRTLYPTRETRRFLARESSRRLARLGVSVPTRIAEGGQRQPQPRRIEPPPPPVTQPKPVTTKPPTKTAAKPKATPKTAQDSVAPKPHTTKQPKPAEKTAKATTTKPKTPHIESTPVPKPKPVPPAPTKIAETTVTTPPPIVSTTTAALPPPPVPTTTTATTSVSPPPTTTTATTTTTAAPATDTTVSAQTTSTTDTSVTAAPDTAQTATSVPAEKQNGNMNLILAVVLILVGIGVLVVLFRASD